MRCNTHEACGTFRMRFPLLFAGSFSLSVSIHILTYFPNNDFLDDYYVSMAALDGEAFSIDSGDVHAFIVNFTVGNATAETKIQAYEGQNNGRLDFIALREHYEGVWLHALDITKAETIINTLFYSGEKKPHMWWEEFEKPLISAFTIFNQREGRIVHSDEMKLRMLQNKVQADFLVHVKASIGIILASQPITLSYEQALATFRNEVNRKFPPQMSTTTRTRRSINEMSAQGRGRGARFGRGRGPPHGGRGMVTCPTQTIDRKLRPTQVGQQTFPLSLTG
jgi:hypothetical protein